ncbi:MAG TPA: MBL fold metallo-hydrolase [Bryobacteraceae bacterium]|nr:MBL fold metallo-hydrolase [Bryobacteraceae bacterium]
MLRRTLVAGMGLAGVAGTGAVLYRASPMFWRQFGKELGRPILPPPQRPDPSRWPDRGVYAAWLGHATVLLKIDGTTILTDPVFSDRVGLYLGVFTLGLKRLVAPALDESKLPRIDLVLLSHAHMDHFDIPSLRALERKETRVVTASKTGDLLRPERYGAVHELGWGDRVQVGAVSVRAFEVNHWGARMRSDTWRGYNGYLIEAGRYRVLFGGDTAETTLFRNLRSSRRIDLAIMPVGAYNPWIHYHCTPEQAWRMGNDAGAEFFIPVHHRTFQLSREPYNEPIERFCHAAGRHTDRVGLHEIGQQFQVS